MSVSFVPGTTYDRTDGKQTLCVYRFADGRGVFVALSVANREYAYVVQPNGRSIDGNNSSIIFPDPTEEFFA